MQNLIGNDVDCIYYEVSTTRAKGSSESKTIKEEKFRFIGKMFQVNDNMQFRLFQMQVSNAMCVHVINCEYDIGINNMLEINNKYYRILKTTGTLYDMNIYIKGYDEDVAS